MINVNVCLLMLASVVVLAGCSSSSKDGIQLQDGDGNNFTVKENEVISEDGMKGFKGDLETTNLQTLYEGLTFEKVTLLDGDDKKIESEEIAMNSKFSIVIEGIKNYTLKDGKVFPKLTLMLLGETGPIVAEEDALASYTDGMSVEDASVVRGTFTVAQPMVTGKQYTCSVSVTDKNNAAATISSTWFFKVK